MEPELIRRAKARDGEAMATIATELEGMIKSTVQRIQPFSHDRENLIGEGFLILMECIDDFDEDRGVLFRFIFGSGFVIF